MSDRIRSYNRYAVLHTVCECTRVIENPPEHQWDIQIPFQISRDPYPRGSDFDTFPTAGATAYQVRRFHHDQEYDSQNRRIFREVSDDVRVRELEQKLAQVETERKQLWNVVYGMDEGL